MKPPETGFLPQYSIATHQLRKTRFLHPTRSLQKPGFYHNTRSSPTNSEKPGFSTPPKASRNRVFMRTFATADNLRKNPVSQPHPKPQAKSLHLSYNQNHPLHPIPAMRHWQPEQQLQNGKYIIQEILGGGAFGVTYRAQNPKEGKTVAIKTLNANVQGKPNFREYQTKFVNEALSLAKCSHPNVVQVYEVFPETVGNIELWCMVMELIDGTNLAEYLEDNGILSEAKALPIIQQVGSALSFVHQQGFTHLDVKPQNIMLRPPPAPPW
jgi:Protein kinase domain